MRWQLVLPIPVKWTSDHIALMDWLLTSRFLADALETSAPRRTLAPTVARSSLLSFIPKSFLEMD